MAMMKSQDSDDNLARQEPYAYTYDSAFTLKHHASRTAASHAAFFLPYLQPGMSLLDCGSGSGSITGGLAQVVAPGQVTGIDISEVEITRARGSAAVEGIANVHFEVGNVYKLAYPAQSFEAVFAHNVLEHVGEPVKAFRVILSCRLTTAHRAPVSPLVCTSPRHVIWRTNANQRLG